MVARTRARPAAREDTPDSRSILEAAKRLLADEGPSALTMRRLAQASRTSTMVLYTRFGSRDAVIEALLADGFSRFADMLGAVAEADPTAHLRELGRAYRRFALANPTSYRLMWMGLQPADCERHLNESKAAPHGARAFSALIVAVTRLLAAKDRPAKDAEPLAMAVWSTVHGFVSLELNGAAPPGVDVESLYERALEFAVAGVVAR